LLAKELPFLSLNCVCRKTVCFQTLKRNRQDKAFVPIHLDEINKSRFPGCLFQKCEKRSIWNFPAMTKCKTNNLNVLYMRVVLQRASKASVTINEKETRSIQKGLMILVGIENEDGDEDIKWLVNKIVNLRIFDDEKGVMDRSVLDIDGEILVVSQFTLHARTKKGNRPSYVDAAKPDVSVPLYERFKNTLSGALSKTIVSGEFGASMAVELVNDGPVTIIIDTKDKK
jgi:D-tyrosyl-tRNA(Tyr) deacylase